MPSVQSAGCIPHVFRSGRSVTACRQASQAAVGGANNLEWAEPTHMRRLFGAEVSSAGRRRFLSGFVVRRRPYTLRYEFLVPSRSNRYDAPLSRDDKPRAVRMDHINHVLIVDDDR